MGFRNTARMIMLLGLVHCVSAQGRLVLEKTFVLDQSKNPLGKIYDMAVDEKENIYVPDSSFSNLKIYNREGQLVRIIGRKGSGPEEFLSPAKIALNKDLICIQDLGQLNYILYNRNFREFKRIFYLLSGHSFILDEDRIIANESYRDGEGRRYKGVILNMEGKVIRTLLPIKKKAGTAWEAATESFGFVDMSEEGDIFLAKSGGVTIHKFGRNGMLLKSFGRPPSYFLPPSQTRDFEKMAKEGRSSRGREAGDRWYKSSSWVSGLFLIDEYVGLVIRTFDKEKARWRCDAQIYDVDGKLIEDRLRLTGVGDATSSGFVVTSDHSEFVYILEESPDEPAVFRFFKFRFVPR